MTDERNDLLEACRAAVLAMEWRLENTEGLNQFEHRALRLCRWAIAGAEAATPELSDAD